MTLRVTHTSVDCHDAYTQSTWWVRMLGYHEDPHDQNRPGDEECMIFSPDGSHRILFIEVPEAKQLKNRLHFDLQPTDATRDEEIERIRGLGATDVADLRQPDGRGWLVLADPEGNEFCILRSDAERRAAGDEPFWEG